MDINKINYDGLPSYMEGGMRRYIENGIHPGGFLSAVLCNDLKRACAQADDDNRKLLYEYVQWLYNEAPSGCWGSPEKFNNWQGTVTTSGM